MVLMWLLTEDTQAAWPFSSSAALCGFDFFVSLWWLKIRTEVNQSQHFAPIQSPLNKKKKNIKSIEVKCARFPGLQTWVFSCIAYMYWKEVCKPPESALRTTGGTLTPDRLEDKWKKKNNREYWGDNPAGTCYSDHSDKTLALKCRPVTVLLLPWCQPVEWVFGFTQKLAVDTPAYRDCIVLTSVLHASLL